MTRVLALLLTTMLVAAYAFAAAVKAAPNPGSPAHAHPGQNVNAKRAAVARKLNRGLRGTPMHNTGWILEREGWRQHINPAFVAGVAAFEGGFNLVRHTGLTPCLPFNPYGISSCGRAWTAPRFNSWAESFEYAMRFLKERWPHAQTPYDFHGYCSCGSAYWGAKVAEKMRQLGFAATVRYGP